MKTAYLSLGSNQGNREEYLQRALDVLARERVRPLRCSAVYETEPQEVRDQPWFLNLVAEVETGLFPMQLLSKVLGVERELGRERGSPKGPRVIDIDILFHGRFAIDTPQLVVPHPRLHLRRFVLQPMADLAPELRHPLLNRSVKELLRSLEGQAVTRVAFLPRIPGTEPGAE